MVDFEKTLIGPDLNALRDEMTSINCTLYAEELFDRIVKTIVENNGDGLFRLNDEWREKLITKVTEIFETEYPNSLVVYEQCGGYDGSTTEEYFELLNFDGDYKEYVNFAYSTTAWLKVEFGVSVTVMSVSSAQTLEYCMPEYEKEIERRKQ